MKRKPPNRWYKGFGGFFQFDCESKNQSKTDLIFLRRPHTKHTSILNLINFPDQCLYDGVRVICGNAADAVADYLTHESVI